jgi:hypothetical protein
MFRERDSSLANIFLQPYRYHANSPAVIRQHTSSAERNTTSIPAAVLLYSFICAYRKLQGTFVVFKGQVAESSVFYVLRHFKV